MWRSLGGMDLAVVRPASGGFPRHSHDEYVISANVHGHERVRLDRTSFEAGTAEVTVYNPGQVQSCTTQTRDAAAWSCVSLYVDPAEMTALTGEVVDFERPVLRAPRLRAELLRAVTADEDGPLLRERMTVLVLDLLDRAGGRPRGAAVPADDLRVASVVDRLRADLTAAPRLADLAADVGLSREQLIRTFRAATGSPPYAWHLQARLAAGRRRLRLGHRVADVAVELGFADQAHFHKHFRAAYAVTPARYRAVNI